MKIHFPQFPGLFFHHLLQPFIFILLLEQQLLGQYICLNGFTHDDIAHRDGKNKEDILFLKESHDIKNRRCRQDQYRIYPIDCPETPV